MHPPYHRSVLQQQTDKPETINHEAEPTTGYQDEQATSSPPKLPGFPRSTVKPDEDLTIGSGSGAVDGTILQPETLLRH